MIYQIIQLRKLSIIIVEPKVYHHLNSQQFIFHRDLGLQKQKHFKDDDSINNFPRSSSFSRPRVAPTNNANDVQQNISPTNVIKKTTNYATDTDVIRAFKTGEMSSQVQPSLALKSKSTPYLKHDSNDIKSKPVAVLKENSIMQRLLMERQDEPSVRSKNCSY